MEAPAGVLSGLVVVRAGEQASNGSPFTVTASGAVSRVSAAAREGGTAPAINKLSPVSGPAEAGAALRLSLSPENTVFSQKQPALDCSSDAV